MRGLLSSLDGPPGRAKAVAETATNITKPAMNGKPF
jgi:hypothetical protein